MCDTTCGKPKVNLKSHIRALSSLFKIANIFRQKEANRLYIKSFGLCKFVQLQTVIGFLEGNYSQVFHFAECLNLSEFPRRFFRNWLFFPKNLGGVLECLNVNF